VIRSLLLAAVAVVSMLAPPVSVQTPVNRQQHDDWPVVTRETKPWTRWWWHGSAVDPARLTAELEALRKAGLGGVEITPVFGVRGEEARFIPYLSDEWTAVLRHTLEEAARVDLGVDLATGTGWPFGGPWVGDDSAPRSLVSKTWTLAAGERLPEAVRVQQTPMVRAIGRSMAISDLAEPVTANANLQALAIEQIKYPRDLPLVALVAYGASGAVHDLTRHVTADRLLPWQAPEPSVVYAVFAGWHGKLVERAAPGGEGNVIDHFSRPAIRSYLARFDRAFNRRPPSGLRAFFNDSYEVDDASGQGDWTPSLLDEFRKRRGYDLRRYLPALVGRDTADLNARVIADYRTTMSDLLLQTFTAEWRSWARRRGSVVRNQAHGSPANLLDLYAASDIPETEGEEIARFKWASSAANVAGRRLVAAEAATWLGEHFRVSLADVRAAVDHFFAGGVNHIVYHGTAYSPDDAPWPGWQFYASVEFNPRSAWWDDFAALNEYITRTQSFLQSGRADHDVLLYFPFADAVSTRGDALLTHFGGANRPTFAAGFEAAAALLQSRGFAYDYISDAQVRRSRSDGGRILTEGGGSYAALVLPSSRYIPEETLGHLLDLARSGATIVIWRDWPADVAGLADLAARRERFRRAIAGVRLGEAREGISEARLGSGRVVRSDDLVRALAHAGVRRERMADQGLLFARRRDARGRFFFISNRTANTVDGWVPINTTAAQAMIFDPMSGRRGGARVRESHGGELDVYLQIAPGESLIVAEAPRADRDPFELYRAAGTAVQIAGTWAVRFLDGGPTLPDARNVERLASWAEFGGDEVRIFSGRALYTTTFARPPANAAAWRLDLGRVHESAQVRLNGRDIGTLIGPWYRVDLPADLLRDVNALEIRVANLSANRIADLDRRGVAWKKFYNINMPSRLPENHGDDGLFTAAKWEPLPSGLIGPVTLTPLAVLSEER
jgi:hypothetical protein